MSVGRLARGPTSIAVLPFIISIDLTSHKYKPLNLLRLCQTAQALRWIEDPETYVLLTTAKI